MIFYAYFKKFKVVKKNEFNHLILPTTHSKLIAAFWRQKTNISNLLLDLCPSGEATPICPFKLYHVVLNSIILLWQLYSSWALKEV
jgi:hypothetical protein